MFKLAPKGEKISVYGYIMNAKTIHGYNKRIGYRIIIKTTITIILYGEEIPIYIYYVEKQPKTELYNWFVRNSKNKAPVYVTGRKRFQKLGKNEKMEYESAKKVLWIYLYDNKSTKVIPLTEGIPPKYENLVKKLN